jgi:hypothetical protein
MGWGRSNALRRQPEPDPTLQVTIEPDPVDWDRLVTLDFETYYDADYTLKKLSTSEYVRDPRFKAQMVGIKIGRKPTKTYPAAKIKAALRAIPWQTHSLLAHHAQFDGFILSHHYGIQPKKLYCTMSMARGLYSNDIGAGLDEVSRFCGGGGKIDADSLAETLGVRDWPPALVKRVGVYCAGDVDECFRCFVYMHPMMPRDEMDIIDVTCRMFTDPVLKVDLPRVQKELEREIAAKRTLMLAVAEKATDEKLTKKEIGALGEHPSEEDLAIRRAKKLIGSARFADLLRDEGIEPPLKISPAWIAAPKEERKDEDKWAYAFAKTDLEFIKLQEHPSERVRDLVEARLAVKSNSNETRAGRFLKMGENGQSLPVYLKYGAALTLRWGGGNKTNFQNLKRGGELRKSILAPAGHVICVKDSGQIEARTNAWLWGQNDLIEEFRAYDLGLDRDPYCKFGDVIYNRPITKADELERFVGKTGILGLGYQMGAERFQNTLALGADGPAVHLELDECRRIVNAYRRKNHRIKAGWSRAQEIIEMMARGIPGSHKCISWDKETIFLPNGMTMRYPGLHDKRIAKIVARKLTGVTNDVDDDFDPNWPEFVYESKGVETKIYGGKLVENIVQCLARLIVAKQLLEISRKARVVMTTHDEVAALAKRALAAKIDAYMQQAMMKPLPWCMDLPLNAEGGYDTFYSK